ncbi:MAG: AIM24 family protein [Eubacteriales bacterium]|nr:AIM24 family protein [Eubacteriales bacterium]
MFRIHNLTGDKHQVTAKKGPFSIVEHIADYSVSPVNAAEEYFMAQMNVRRRQVIAELTPNSGIVLQAGAMQWTAGNVSATTGVKGVGDLFGKMIKGSVTKESAIKPEYVGTGILVTEPTFKYLLLEDAQDWEGGLVVEDGMFLACENSVRQEIQARSTFSSAIAGNEGLFNLKLNGKGVCVLESNVPRSEIVEVVLENDVLKIDGSFAICWSGSLQFTVERSGKTLVGSAVSGEGLVNVYKGTGRVLLAPLTPSSSLFAATNLKNAK